MDDPREIGLDPVEENVTGINDLSDLSIPTDLTVLTEPAQYQGNDTEHTTMGLV